MKRLIAPLSTILMFALTSVAVAEDLQSELTALEKSLWTASSKKDPAPYRKVVTDDAVQITSSGVLTGKEAIIKDQMSCDVRSFACPRFRIASPSVSLNVISYRCARSLVARAQRSLRPTARRGLCADWP